MALPGEEPTGEGKETAWLRWIISHVTDLISVISPEGTVTYASPAADRVLGYAPEELVGDSMFDRIHPEDRAAVTEAMEAARRSPGRVQQVEVRVRHGDGGWIRVEARGVRPEDREEDVTVVLSRDVTDRWEAERALEQALEKYDTFFELIPVGVVLSDPETGRMREVNQRFLEIFGYAEEEVIGRTSLDLEMWESEKRRSELVERVGREGDVRGREGWFRTKEGERRRMVVSARRLELAGQDHLLWAVDDVTERRRRDETLHLQRDALEATDHAIVITARDGTIEWVNPAFTEMTGWDREEALGRTPRMLRSGEQDEAFYETFWETILTGQIWSGEIVNRRKDGELYTEWMSVVPVRHDSDEITHFIALKRDVSERRAREEALRRSEERYRALFEDSVDPVLLTARDGRMLAANAAFTERFGYEADDLEGMPVAELYVEAVEREAFAAALRERGTVRDMEVTLETRSGETRVCRVSARAHRDPEGEIDYVQGVLHDVTELKRMEDRLRHRALHDPLTDVANRDLLRERLEGALARSARSGGAVAVAVVDLNRFKRVNDSLGHAAGDRVLREVADRLRQTLREQDTVARIGGDEFALLLEDVDGELGVRGVLDRVLRKLSEPYEVAGESVHLEQAVGVAHHHPGGGLAVREPEDLVRYADLAMYRVKDDAESVVSFFRPEAGRDRMTVVRREHELREAIDEGRLVPWFQPVVELSSGRVVGLEVLARWEHPELGILSPDRFLPLAEESGLIVPLGYRVCEEAYAALAAWNGDRRPSQELSIWINLSVRQLAEEDVGERLLAMAAAHGVSPAAVTVEVTETGLMRSSEAADRLAAHGFRLAIDDFGTGYASLAYLRLLAVDVLKVDRSFVAGLGQHPTDSAIVETVVTLGRSLGIDVLAEGIESEYQLRRLRELGYRLGQGYLFGRAAPGAEVPELLASSRPGA